MEIVSLGAENGGPSPHALLRNRKTGGELWLGCPEGSARACLEHGVRPSMRAKCILATRWEGIGSLALRMSQDGLGEIAVVGPVGLEQWMSALGGILCFRTPRVFVQECGNDASDGPVYDDDDFAIWAVAERSGELEPVSATSWSSASVKDAWRTAKQARIAGNASTEGSVPSLEGFTGRRSSGVATHEFTRKLCQKCAMYAWDKRADKGADSLYGFVVHVKGQGAVGIIASEKAGPSLTNTFQQCSLVVVLSHERLDIPSSLLELLRNIRRLGIRVVCPLGRGEHSSEANMRVLGRLHPVAPSCFPVPADQDGNSFDEVGYARANREGDTIESMGFRERWAFRQGHWHSCGRYTRVMMGQERSEFFREKSHDEERTRSTLPEIVRASKEAVEGAHGLTIGDLPREESSGTLTFLGTGSAEPSKYRGPSAILLSIGSGASERTLMIEAGEGARGAMEVLMDESNAITALAKLEGILVSHAHADHILGLPGIVRAWRRAAPFGKRLSVVAPQEARRLLAAANELEGIDFRQPRSRCVETPCQGLNVQSMPVEHTQSSVAFWISFSSAEHELIRVGFSGDCRPNRDLGYEWRRNGVDVVVHEATFEDGRIEDAQEKRHSTVGEALAIGALARPFCGTILTHFSQRYPGVPDLPRDVPCVPAFDGMRVDARVLPSLAKRVGLMESALTVDKEHAESGKVGACLEEECSTEH